MDDNPKPLDTPASPPTAAVRPWLKVSPPPPAAAALTSPRFGRHKVGERSDSQGKVWSPGRGSMAEDPTSPRAELRLLLDAEADANKLPAAVGAAAPIVAGKQESPLPDLTSEGFVALSVLGRGGEGTVFNVKRINEKVAEVCRGFLSGLTAIVQGDQHGDELVCKRRACPSLAEANTGLQEAIVGARVSSHPCLVRVEATFLQRSDVAGRPDLFFLGIVMQKCGGGDLMSMLLSGEAVHLKDDDICRYMAAVCSGVAELHRSGLIHRDMCEFLFFCFSFSMHLASFFCLSHALSSGNYRFVVCALLPFRPIRQRAKIASFSWAATVPRKPENLFFVDPGRTALVVGDLGLAVWTSRKVECTVAEFSVA
jgi:hypothetical protein